jgi:hypothetical protein
MRIGFRPRDSDWQRRRRQTKAVNGGCIDHWKGKKEVNAVWQIARGRTLKRGGPKVEKEGAGGLR